MPAYDFGDWSQIGSDIGAKIAGRPSARQARDADRTLAIKMAQDKEDYQREQDRIKNFAAYGGDPEQVMAGSQQDALLSDPELAAFQAGMVPSGVMRREFQDPSKFDPAAERAFRRFQEKQGSRGLSFEQRKELERLHAEETRRTKAQPGGGTVNKYADTGVPAVKPLEDTTGSSSWWKRVFGRKKDELDLFGPSD